MVIDVSGLDMFKELKPVDFNTKGLPQALNARNAKLFQERMMRHMADRDQWTQKQFNLIPKNFWKNY